MEAVGAGLDRASAEALLRAMHEHTSEDAVQRIAPLIHEDAQMRLLVSFGKLLEGREAVMEALTGSWAADTFRARVLRFEWLDDFTSLTFAHARYALEGGGFAEGNVYWLDEIRDGRIWRVQVFRDETEAHRSYRRAPAEV
jgi:hypothetical protein